MKRLDVKSACPINFSIEIIGDAWSMLIIREIANLGGRTFGDLLSVEERIGTSTLTDKLAHLETAEIIAKASHKKDKRRSVYTLTNKGIDLLPVLYEIAAWGSRNSPHPVASAAWFKAITLDRGTVIKAWQLALRSDSSFLEGPHSVVKQLSL